jgi:hypothetical protein
MSPKEPILLFPTLIKKRFLMTDTTKITLLTLAIVLVSSAANADGFKLRLEGNKIVAKNNEGIVPDFLFGHAFDVTNSGAGTYESSHGSVDANDAGSGFNFPSGGPNDSFTYHILGLWTYSGGIALPASSGAVLQISRASNSALLSQIVGIVATPPSFPITATTTHELVWSVPQSSSVDVWGLEFSISGNSALTGLAYEPSDRLVSVQWTPDFQGDPDAAMQAIYDAAVPEPSTTCLCVGIGCALGWSRKGIFGRPVI